EEWLLRQDPRATYLRIQLPALVLTERRRRIEAHGARQEDAVVPRELLLAEEADRHEFDQCLGGARYRAAHETCSRRQVGRTEVELFESLIGVVHPGGGRQPQRTRWIEIVAGHDVVVQQCAPPVERLRAAGFGARGAARD